MMICIEHALNGILSKQMPDGGFYDSCTNSFSPEATAWSVLALKASETHLDKADRACKKLALVQSSDGWLSAVQGYDAAVWPTPLCILAWKCMRGYEQPIHIAVQFLLSFKGQHFEKKPDSPIGNDPSIIGWPWIDNTHSWITPTCLSIIALRACGYRNHNRTKEAARMIMDRQLPKGGWNYGNTTVFGKELLPIPENTGQALCALRGITQKEPIALSLAYLVDCAKKVRTPMALAWILQGLSAWTSLPPGWEAWIKESLALQEKYGVYDTALLAHLLCVYFTKGRISTIMV